jgi:hypothetical protein
VGPDDVRWAEPLADLLESWDGAEAALAVDCEGSLAATDDQLDLVARRLDLGDLDPARSYGPDIAVAADALGPVGGLDRLFHGFGESAEGVVRLVLVDQQVAVRQCHEVHLVAVEARRVGGRHRVPAAWSRNAVDPDSAPVWPRVDGRRLSLGDVVEAGLARELLVNRLAPEDHCGSISP